MFFPNLFWEEKKVKWEIVWLCPVFRMLNEWKSCTKDLFVFEWICCGEKNLQAIRSQSFCWATTNICRKREGDGLFKARLKDIVDDTWFPAKDKVIGRVSMLFGCEMFCNWLIKERFIDIEQHSQVWLNESRQEGIRRYSALGFLCFPSKRSL